jgi:hypothetical protein
MALAEILEDGIVRGIYIRLRAGQSPIYGFAKRGSQMADRDGAERRRYPRVKARIPVEMRSLVSPAPSRAVTEEVSLCGCYIETMFTLDVGAKIKFDTLA